MTTEELQDWHAIRAGWEMRCGQWRRDCPERREYKYHPSHPFPATIDGAASAMPPGWHWQRKVEAQMVLWKAFHNDYHHALRSNLLVVCGDTQDEIHDRYLLAKLAWEAMTHD